MSCFAVVVVYGFFLAAPRDLQYLSSPLTRDQTQVPSSGKV